MVNGTMGAGKTSTCLQLLEKLQPSVLLDGDWCWKMNPFVVTEETKRMVTDNIAYLLRSFLLCSQCRNVIFCWVMHRESIMDDILKRLEGLQYEVYRFTLTVSRRALTERITRDIENGLRTPDVLNRSLERLPLYDSMATHKIDVSDVTPAQAAEVILNSLKESDNHAPIRS